MRKGLIFLIFFAMSIFAEGQNIASNPFVKELMPSIKRKKSITVYKIKTDKNCAHPQTLTLRQASKILHSIKVKTMFPVLIFNAEEVRRVVRDFVKNMATAGKHEMVVIEKKQVFFDAKTNKKMLERVDKLFFWFKDKDDLVVSYYAKGYDMARTLKEGFHVKYFRDEKGKVHKSTVIIKRDVWEKYLNRPVFEKDYEMIWQNLNKNPEVEKPGNAKTKKESINKPEQNGNKISVEEMEKRLQKLKEMRDKKLISEEEYKRMKEKVLKEAGF